MRYKITLSYDGAPFCGWQRQPDAPSVQEALETALQTLLGEPVSVTGAGRTDTGVSAVGYVAHFDASGEPDASFLACKLNAILPPAVAVLSVEPASPDFHARFDAKKRSYTYYLHRCKDPFMAGRSFFYGYPEVDFELMNKAAAMLPGTHDFSCFQKVGSDARTSVCTVFEAEWRPYTPALEAATLRNRLASLDPTADAVPPLSVPRVARVSEGSASRAPQYWYFRISADRFLRNMVRAIVGTLLEVGRGRRSLDEFAGLILPPSQDSRIAQGAANGIPRRSLAGESVSGHALFLTGIEY
ncbi:MAG: tRNA pseudouridine(38-40) synthase TruA [Bacteroidales bacterium]|nr:tRNA pseudouridine(38-40) synthase TruA [Bacteroidales bacterium]